MLSKITYFLPVAVIVVATVFYHVAQKSMPANVDPIISLLISYLSAAVLCLGTYPFLKHETSFLNELKKINWSSFVVGISVLVIELGFCYAYRMGWNISKASLFTNSIIVVLLLLIGLLFYNEKVTALNGVGIVLCMVGVFLIGR